jgi:antitoxin ParD1/3/4
MQVRKTISLTKRDEDFINAQIHTGEFNNSSEVLRAGLRLLEQEQLRLQALRLAVAEGDADAAAGRLTGYAPGDVAARMKAALRGR